MRRLSPPQSLPLLATCALLASLAPLTASLSSPAVRGAVRGAVLPFKHLPVLATSTPTASDPSDPSSPGFPWREPGDLDEGGGVDLKQIRAVVMCLERRRTDRCDVVVPGLKRVFPRLEEASAVDASVLDLADTSLVSPLTRAAITYSWTHEKMYINQRGALGCMLSHVNIWKRAIELGEPILAIEDDLAIDAASEAHLRAAMAVLPRDADFAGLFFWRNPDFTDHDRSGLDPWVQITGPTYLGTLAYYVTPRGAAILLDAAVPVVTHVDRWIGFKAAQRADFRAYRLRTVLYTETVKRGADGGSTIVHRGSIKAELPHGNWFFVLFIAALAVSLALNLRAYCWLPCRSRQRNGSLGKHI